MSYHQLLHISVAHRAFLTGVIGDEQGSLLPTYYFHMRLLATDHVALITGWRRKEKYLWSS